MLNYHPNLLEDVNVVRTHTALHLAARNGHMNAVSYFLSCGMDVNITVIYVSLFYKLSSVYLCLPQVLDQDLTQIVDVKVVSSKISEVVNDTSDYFKITNNLLAINKLIIK